jgi:methyl-accepting chemotaxis protein
MERVRESATGIDSVIEGLDKIAFQTRVLAMNAAVEAGRAGDAGRGFAVVADLVSSLAMRAEEEAKRARDQLTVTQTDIGAAVQAVRNVDSALADISGDVGEVHTLLGSMATDNQAQSSAISQISVAISAMDQSTQQNAAMVEETSAAARNLTAEVASLAEQAALFKVHKGSRAAAPGRKTAKAPMERAAPPTPYLSPVKPRPVSRIAVAESLSNGAALSVGASSEDWSDF